MPYSIRTDDGIEIFDIPDSMDVNDPILRDRINEIRSQESTALDKVSAAGKAAGSIVSSAIMEPIAGIAGLGRTLRAGGLEGADVVQGVRDWAYTPKDLLAQQYLGNIGEALEPITQTAEGVTRAAGDSGYRLGGSVGGAIASAVPAAIAELLGAGLINRMKAGRPLVVNGEAIPALEKRLNDRGLSFDSLSDEVKSSITGDATYNPITNRVKPIAEDIAVKQLEANPGNKDLIEYKVKGNRLKKDQAVKEAMKQGFSKDIIATAKAASPETKKSLMDIMTGVQKVKSGVIPAYEFRSTDIPGKSLEKRIKYINAKNDLYVKDLDNLVKTRLKGVKVDITPVSSALKESLDKLDIRIDTPKVDSNLNLIDSNGAEIKPTLDFKGSMISKDKASQRFINDLVDLMAEGSNVDALRFHKIKRQLWHLSDARKKSPAGLTDAGKKVMKSVAASLNKSVRDSVPEYAAINDKISRSIGAIDEIKELTGSKSDIFGAGGHKILGQKARGALSNNTSRVRMENSIQDLDLLAKEFGGGFNDNIMDLVYFADSIEDRFGTQARTSLKGQAEGGGMSSVAGKAAVAGSGATGATMVALDAATKAIGKKINNTRNVGDLQAFKAMKELLKGDM